MPILVSACLIGMHCRYNGKAKPVASVVQQIQTQDILIPVCPEQLGGLPTPRVPCEIIGGDGHAVLQRQAYIQDSKGYDYTIAYEKGAREVLYIATQYAIQEAWLMARSPSCGCGQIYDGSFSGKLRDGDGVCTALLKKHGIMVRSIASDTK